VSDLGKCPECGCPDDVYVRQRFNVHGQPAELEQWVWCGYCERERPDLVCRNGRIEKREE
jgi:hypothetical protein